MSHPESPAAGAPALAPELFVTHRFAEAALRQGVETITPYATRIDVTAQYGAQRYGAEAPKIGTLVFATMGSWWNNDHDTYHLLKPGQTLPDAKELTPISRDELTEAARATGTKMYDIFTSTVTEKRLASGLYTAASRASSSHHPINDVSNPRDRVVGAINGGVMGEAGSLLIGNFSVPSVVVAGGIGVATGATLVAAGVHFMRRHQDISVLVENPPFRINEAFPYEVNPEGLPPRTGRRERPAPPPEQPTDDTARAAPDQPDTPLRPPRYWNAPLPEDDL